MTSHTPKKSPMEIASTLFENAGASVTVEHSRSMSERHGPSESVYLLVKKGERSAKLRFSGHDNGLWNEHDSYRLGVYGAIKSAMRELGIPIPAHVSRKAQQWRSAYNDLGHAQNRCPNRDALIAAAKQETLALHGQSALTGREKRQAIARYAKEWMQLVKERERTEQARIDAEMQPVIESALLRMKEANQE